MEMWRADYQDWVPADDARQLERELAEARADGAECRKQLIGEATLLNRIFKLTREGDGLRHALREAMSYVPEEGQFKGSAASMLQFAAWKAALKESGKRETLH